jgi:secreted PhoX family phosphatase
MTTTHQKRLTLPLTTADGPHGSRSAATCHYRCGNACDFPEPNTSGNEHFSTVASSALLRRSVLRGAGVGAGALVIGSLAGSAAAAGPVSPARAGRGALASTDDWTPVEPNVRDAVTVPAGYKSRPVINWGDPVLGDAPAFDPLAQTEESASKQFGYNSDYVGVLPLSGSSALLCVNHEYTNEELMFPATGYSSAQIKRIAIQSHGLSIVKVHKVGGPASGEWRTSDPDNKYNRRITGTTEFEVTGPAAGDARLKTSADPSGRKVLGTLNNCAGGQTPWGTVLSGEENFNQYFDKSGTLDARYTASYARYGISGSGTRGWSEVDPRFDLSQEPHEPFRFGWIVEIDPYDPKSTPRKQTMLGRFKHEGANIIIADNGRAVAYMGDDERGDYIYKFVSADTFDPRDTQAARLRNRQLLTRGTLYVARLIGDDVRTLNADGSFVPADGEYDGTGEWIPLTSDTTSYVAGFSVNDVLVNTRLAADAVSPTRMDRPEDVQPNPVNRKIYAALTNNSDRATKWPVDEPNPLARSHTRPELGAALVQQKGNRNGYVLEITEAGGDHSGTAFAWFLLLVCGEPTAPETYFAGFPKDQVSQISCPDNVAFDEVGNLWISTDGAVLGGNDGLFRVPVEGAKRGQVQQFLTVPTAAETCGPLVNNDDKSIWVAVQHPGEETGSTFATPSSTWPHTHDFPRPGVVVTWKA